MPVDNILEAPAQVVVSVSKRNFSGAVQRNRIKRLIRESYRKNKQILYNYLSENNKQCVLALVYTGNKMQDYHRIESIIIIILQRLIKEYEKVTG